jgi:predicted nucleic acid-binding protein
VKNGRGVELDIRARRAHVYLVTRADDDAVLALAVAARPDLIISSDSDLLVLGGYCGIPIVNAAEAIAMTAAG